MSSLLIISNKIAHIVPSWNLAKVGATKTTDGTLNQRMIEAEAPKGVHDEKKKIS